tara:strand:+ start:720 stop:1826 length:1107 start_codon:yes stop_codon:yes gene_type:complete
MFIVIVSLYFVFMCWIINGLNNIEQNKDDEKFEFISIVVSVKNEEDNIQNLLNALSNQDYPKDLYELIIVNDKSSDDTLNILNKNSSEIKNLKIINITETPNDWSNKKWALSQAIEKSSGEIILQTDGDCMPEKKWIKEMVKPFSKAQIGFVAGYTPLKEIRNNFLEKILIFENLAQDAFFASCMGKGLTMSCAGRSIAFRKKYFLDVDGYEDMKNIESGDDDLLMHRIISDKKCEKKYVISNNSFVHSEAPFDLGQFINQRMRFASKGKLYYSLFYISSELKLILPFLLLINIIGIISILTFCSNPKMISLLPWILKTAADGIFLRIFCNSFHFKFDTYSFFILSLLHPFYIVMFSIIAPFKKYTWK